MDSVENSDKKIANSVQYRKQLIVKVKEHPCIWDDSKTQRFIYSDRQNAWESIEREMGCQYDLKEIQTTWALLSETYFRLIFVRTIERNFEAPVWIFFHELTFLYDQVKETIQKQLGGISPPLFKRRPNANGYQRQQCPCCANEDDRPDLNSEAEPIDFKLEQEDGSEKITTTTSETSFQNTQDTTENSNCSLDSETKQFIGYLNAIDSDSTSYSLANSPDPQQNDNVNSAVLSPRNTLINKKNLEVIELTDDSESNESSSSRLPPASLENMTDYHSSKDVCHLVRKSHSMRFTNCVDSEKPQVSEFNGLTSLNERNSLTQPGNHLISPGINEVSNERINSEKEVRDLLAPVRNCGSTRYQIIDVVRAYPNAYLFNARSKKKPYLRAWDQIAEELGNVPLHALKTRWKMIRNRYLKELVLERYSKEMQKSSWELFDQMEFLRPHMQEEIDEIHRTRVQMQNEIKKQTEESLKSPKSSLNLNEPIIDGNKLPDINKIRKRSNDQAQLNINPTQNVSCVSGNPNIQLTGGETLNTTKIFCQKPKQLLETSVVLDSTSLPILKNRPIKVTAILQVVPSLDHNNGSNKKAEAPPPAKKLCKSTEPDRNKTKKLRKLAPKILPSLNPVVAKVEIPRAPKPKYTEQHRSQKELPTLDLTQDDELPVTVPTFASNKIATSSSQIVSDDIAKCVYSKVFPDLDLTIDDDNDDVVIRNIGKNRKKR